MTLCLKGFDFGHFQTADIRVPWPLKNALSLENYSKYFCDHLTSTAAHPAFRKTCSMLLYSFNIVCLFSISSYHMYKRTTSEPKGEVARVKLV